MEKLRVWEYFGGQESFINPRIVCIVRATERLREDERMS